MTSESWHLPAPDEHAGETESDLVLQAALDRGLVERQGDRWRLSVSAEQRLFALAQHPADAPALVRFGYRCARCHEPRPTVGVGDELWCQDCRDAAAAERAGTSTRGLSRWLRSHQPAHHD